MLRQNRAAQPERHAIGHAVDIVQKTALQAAWWFALVLEKARGRLVALVMVEINVFRYGIRRPTRGRLDEHVLLFADLNGGEVGARFGVIEHHEIDLPAPEHRRQLRELARERNELHARV